MTNSRAVDRALRHSGKSVALIAAALGLVAATPLTASADEGPTREQILADCESGVGKCTFNEPVLGEAYLGDFRPVSDLLLNCTTSPATQSMTWTDSVSSTDSVGVTLTAGGTIAKLINVSVSATYNHMWTDTHTETSAVNMTVQPGEVGWISRAQVMQKVFGTWQTHYDDPKWDHYYWYVKDTITGPAPNGTDGQKNAVVVKSRKMTAAEKKACSSASAATAKDARAKGRIFLTEDR
ncbi:hypothetical protein [Streptomyces sp. NPDC051776]|uniref:hypothetical protein n=1 Tax=Streptomyces sp. NPDC051776 TaxID=3155414 RepID=UPI00342DC21B